MHFTAFKAVGAPERSLLPVKIYHTENFVKYFKGLSKSLLPLMATLLGNDIVDRTVFEAVCSKLGKTVASCKGLPKRHSRIFLLLKWLKSVNGIDEALKEVLNAVGPTKRDALKETLIKSMNIYTECSEFSHLNLKCFFESGNENDGKNQQDLKGYNGALLPSWFVSALHRCRLPVFMQNAVVLHRIILLCQVECMREASAYMCSQR